MFLDSVLTGCRLGGCAPLSLVDALNPACAEALLMVVMACHLQAVKLLINASMSLLRHARKRAESFTGFGARPALTSAYQADRPMRVRSITSLILSSFCSVSPVVAGVVMGDVIGEKTRFVRWFLGKKSTNTHSRHLDDVRESDRLSPELLNSLSVSLYKNLMYALQGFMGFCRLWHGHFRVHANSIEGHLSASDKLQCAFVEVRFNLWPQYRADCM